MKNKHRTIIVVLFIAVFILLTYVNLRGSYLQYQDLGENYTQVFFTNLKYKYTIFIANFLILYFLIYFTNRGIKKGLKVFFDAEKKPMPKLLNKSIAFVISVLVSTVIANLFMKKVILYTGNTSFGEVDPIFGFDISYFMFQKPLLE